MGQDALRAICETAGIPTEVGGDTSTVSAARSSAERETSMSDPARTKRTKVAREIGSLGRFIGECIEHKEGSSVTLGAIYLRYLQWRAPEAEQLGTATFGARFKRLVVRQVPNCEINSDGQLQAIVVWNVRLKKQKGGRATP